MPSVLYCKIWFRVLYEGSHWEVASIKWGHWAESRWSVELRPLCQICPKANCQKNISHYLSLHQSEFPFFLACLNAYILAIKDWKFNQIKWYAICHAHKYTKIFWFNTHFLKIHRWGKISCGVKFRQLILGAVEFCRQIFGAVEFCRQFFCAMEMIFTRCNFVFFRSFEVIHLKTYACTSLFSWLRKTRCVPGKINFIIRFCDRGCCGLYQLAGGASQILCVLLKLCRDIAIFIKFKNFMKFCNASGGVRW